MRIQISLTKTEKEAATKTLAGIKSIIAGFKKFSDFVDVKRSSQEKEGKLSVINKIVRKPGAIVPSVKDSEEGRTTAVDFSEELVLDSLKITERFFEYFTNISMMFAPTFAFASQKWGEFHEEFKEVNNKYERSQTVRYADNVAIPELLIDEIDWNSEHVEKPGLIECHKINTAGLFNLPFDCDYVVKDGIGKIFAPVDKDTNTHLVFVVNLSNMDEDFKSVNFANEEGSYIINDLYLSNDSNEQMVEVVNAAIRVMKMNNTIETVYL